MPNYPPSTSLMSYCPEEFRKHTHTAIATFIDTSMSIEFFIGGEDWKSWGSIKFCSGKTDYYLRVNSDVSLNVERDVFAAYVGSKEKK